MCAAAVAARVVVGVDDQDPTFGVVTAEVGEEPASEGRSLVPIGEVRQVDPHDEPDATSWRAEADDDGTVPGPEPEAMGNEGEQLARLAHPDGGDLHVPTPPAGGRPRRGHAQSVARPGA